MEEFAVFKNEKFFGIMSIREITNLYYKDKSFREKVENKEIIIYIQNNKAVLAAIEFQHNLDELGEKIKKYYKSLDKCEVI